MKELAIGKLLYPETVERPKTRGECRNGIRPCPYVSCRHHLYLSVSDAGSLQIEHEGEVWDMENSCSLDIAEQGEHSLEEIGELMGFGKERARQMERSGLVQLRTKVQKP